MKTLLKSHARLKTDLLGSNALGAPSCRPILAVGWELRSRYHT